MGEKLIWKLGYFTTQSNMHKISFTLAWMKLIFLHIEAMSRLQLQHVVDERRQSVMSRPVLIPNILLPGK